MKAKRVPRRVYGMLGICIVYWIWSHPRLNSDFGFLFPERKGRVYITDKWSGWFEHGYKMSVISNQPLNLHVPDYPYGSCMENCKTTEDGGFINVFPSLEVEWDLIQPSGNARRPFTVQLGQKGWMSHKEWDTRFVASQMYSDCPLLESKPSSLNHIEVMKYGKFAYEILFNPEKTAFCIDVTRF